MFWFPKNTIENQIQQFVYKHFVLEIYFLIISAIKEFTFKNWIRSSYKKSSP